jgi:hypothetical protein
VQPLTGFSIRDGLVFAATVIAVLSTLLFLAVQGQIEVPGFDRFSDESAQLLIVHTRTPTPAPVFTPTRTRIVVAIPTHPGTPTPTLTPRPRATPTATTAVDAQETRTVTAATTAALSIPVSPTRTATPLPAPVLLEPPAGAAFENRVRFKFSWYRRLLPYERFSIYVRSVHENAEFDWWASEQDILDGGGAIHAVLGAFAYEVNSGLGNIPPGEAFWRVTVVDDRPGVKRPVCPWSEERRIEKRQ